MFNPLNFGKPDETPPERFWMVVLPPWKPCQRHLDANVARGPHVSAHISSAVCRPSRWLSSPFPVPLAAGRRSSDAAASCAATAPRAPPRPFLERAEAHSRRRPRRPGHRRGRASPRRGAKQGPRAGVLHPARRPGVPSPPPRRRRLGAAGGARASRAEGAEGERGRRGASSTAVDLRKRGAGLAGGGSRGRTREEGGGAPRGRPRRARPPPRASVHGEPCRAQPPARAVALRRPSLSSKRVSSMLRHRGRRARELQLRRPACEGAEGRGAEEGRCARGVVEAREGGPGGWRCGRGVAPTRCLPPAQASSPPRAALGRPAASHRRHRSCPAHRLPPAPASSPPHAAPGRPAASRRPSWSCPTRHLPPARGPGRLTASRRSRPARCLAPPETEVASASRLLHRRTRQEGESRDGH